MADIALPPRVWWRKPGKRMESEVKKMPDDTRRFNQDAVEDPSRTAGSNRGRWDIKPGTVFVQSSAFAALADSARLEAKPHGSWVMVSNAKPEEAEQNLAESGWHFSGGTDIEASAFGCDSKVLERAVNRVLQKAADAELDSLEITGVTVRQDSGLDYASVLARATTIRRDLAPDPVGYGINSTVPRIADQETLAV